MGHENGPMAYVPFIRMQNSRFWWAIWKFDGPFGKKMMGPRNLNIHLTAKWTPDSNSLSIMGPSQKCCQNYSITHIFFKKWFGPIPEISLQKTQTMDVNKCLLRYSERWLYKPCGESSKEKHPVNPYKHSVLFVGHRHLRISTICLQNVLLKFE